MRTLKLTIAYDGTKFSGWQRQRPGSGKPTLQATLEDALSAILRERIIILGSGRTDAGVHALGQVAHLRTHSELPCSRLRLALNGCLPPAIVVRDVEEAPPRFHAQFDASSKRYRYQIVMGPVVLPFERLYVKHVREPLNVALMRREAKGLLGRHDMAAFQSAGRPVRDTRRTIFDIQVRRRDSSLMIDIEANGFLYMMVRRIVGTLLEIGRGRRPPGTIARLLKTKDPLQCGPPASARGLTLLFVRYA